jgi:peptide/nickel transport system permease protein
MTAMLGLLRADAAQPWRGAGAIGLSLIAGMALLALLGPLLVSADPAAQDLMRTLEAPSPAHPLGTDHVGRDVLARTVHGAARSIGIALLCVAFATSIGVALGLVAAWRGGWVDAVIMRLADLMLAFPGILLALLLAGFLGGGIVPMLIGIKLTLWPQFARMARNVALGTLAEAHVEAAMLAGFPPRTILLRHVLPPVAQHVMVLATLGVGAAIMSISALGFLGLGLQPPVPEWGAMVSEMLPYLSEAPVQMAAPCLGIFLTVLGFTLAGEAWSQDGVRRTGSP